MLTLKNMLVTAFSGLLITTTSFAEQASYSSFLVNQSDKGATAYTLVKTRVWPALDSGCFIASGQKVLEPGQKTELVIAKGKKGCEEVGVGYAVYTPKDRRTVLGFVSHRFADKQFSIQVSLFCKGNACVFKEFNPFQSGS